MAKQGGWAPPGWSSDPRSGYDEDPHASGGRTEPLTWISLFLGIASFVVLPIVAAIAAIVTAEKAKRAIASSRDGKKGRMLAVAGESLGIVNLVVCPVMIIVVAVTLSSAAAGHVKYNHLHAGSCYDGVGGTFFRSSVEKADCLKPHRAEVTGTFNADDPGHFPGPEGLRPQAVSNCSAVGLTYLGRYSPAGLRIVWLLPDQSLWDNGVHTVVCGLQDADGSLRTGSVHG
jgi:hypothetical protein